MPELPEVETIVRQLKRAVVGLKIKDAWNDWPRQIRTHTLTGLKRQLKSRSVAGVRRRGKYILLDLTGGKTLVIHQKISGHLLFGRWTKQKGSWIAQKGPLKDDPFNRHIRFIVEFTNGRMMGLSDVRRFGRIYLGDTARIANFTDMARIGPEPLEIAKKRVKFHELFAGKKGKIKQVLMDPYFIAGIGNIYADEILWYAGINPLRRVETLSGKEVERIRKYVPAVLKKAIEEGGDSMSDYRNLFGEFGNYQTMHRAYRQTGKYCSKKDGGRIIRIKINARSAHYCPVHQK